MVMTGILHVEEDTGSGCLFRFTYLLFEHYFAAR